MTISGPSYLINGSTVELVCESTPSYPGLDLREINVRFSIQFLTVTELEWSGQTSGKSTSFFYRKDSTDPRQITRSVVEIKVEIAGI